MPSTARRRYTPAGSPLESGTVVGEAEDRSSPNITGAGEQARMRVQQSSPSPPLGAERVGVRWGIPEILPSAHLTFPRLRRGPLPLPPEGRRGINASGR